MYWEYYVSDIYLPVILLSISWHDPADETQECQVNTTPVGRSSRASGEMDTADAAGLIGGSQRLQCEKSERTIVPEDLSWVCTMLCA